MIGSQELLLISLVIILLFGASKLPEFARSFGKASGEYKKAQIESENEIQRLKSPIRETKSISQNIRKSAVDLGINTEGKDEGMLLEEIKAMIKSKA